MHLSVIQILKKYNLYLSPLQGARDGVKDIDKDKDKVLNKDKDKYIVVDSKKIYDPLEVLSFYEAQLNGSMRENGNLDWKLQVPIWLNEHLMENFKDTMHVKNSFKKFYLNLKSNNSGKQEHDYSKL